MSLTVLAGATSITKNIFIRSTLSGAGLTGLVYNTSGLTAYYMLPQAAAVSISLATQTVTGAWSTGGFVEISSANAPGWYRFDIPNAAIASGRFSDIHFMGAANMVDCPLEIELTATDNQNSTNGGMSGISTAPTAAAVATAVWTDTTAGDFTAGLSVGKSVMNGVALGTGLTINAYTGNTAQTGDAYLRIGAAGASLTGITGAALTSAYDFAKGTVAMTESYAAQGATMTPVQALYQTVQQAGQASVSGTTETVKKRDGATTAKTFTINDATNPTAISETT